ncbi:hypothetical protein Ndes2526B_g00234 [Nannochloris sp. 'desiccata']
MNTPVAQPFNKALPSTKSSSSFTAAPRRSISFLQRCKAITEHERYITEVAFVSGTPEINPLISVLQAQGQTAVAPSDRSGLHPFLVPLTEASNGGPLTCLLRWPEGHKGMELPIVRMSRGDGTMELLARSSAEYLHRALAEEDFLQNSSSSTTSVVAAAAGEAGAAVYEPGAVKRSGLPTLEAYLARKACLSPAICETLALAHLKKGDTMSGLITAEWYMRQGNFPDWGRPYEFACGLLAEHGRPEESRDMARIALRTPWWSLKNGYEVMKTAAGMDQIAQGADATRAALEEQDEMANGGALQGKFRTNPKSDKQKRMDEMMHLLNKAAAGEVSWDGIRKDVARELDAAGLDTVARFVELN